MGPGLKSGSPGPQSDPTICVCCLLALTRSISFATSCSSLEEAHAVRPRSVTGSAPVVWNRDVQFLLPSCFYLEPGVWAQIGAAVFRGTAADPTTQLCPGWGPAQAAAHTRGPSWVPGSAGCMARILGTWGNTSGSRQQAACEPWCKGKLSLVRLYSTSSHWPVLFCAAVPCRLRASGCVGVCVCGGSLQNTSLVVSLVACTG